jgi:hypothetical protein
MPREWLLGVVIVVGEGAGLLDGEWLLLCGGWRGGGVCWDGRGRDAYDNGGEEVREEQPGEDCEVEVGGAMRAGRRLRRRCSAHTQI